MAQISDHWWWRPGWRPGRRKYAWHITFGSAPQVRALAARTRERLDGLPGLDLVPDQWLHLTTQGVAFADEITEDELDGIVAIARQRLARIEPVPVTVGPPRVAGEGILCDVSPASSLTPVRDAVRGAISVGGRHAAGGAEWHPHVSFAYASATGPADAYEAALTGFDETAEMTVTAADLIKIGRDDHMYQWETYAIVDLGS